MLVAYAIFLILLFLLPLSIYFYDRMRVLLTQMPHFLSIIIINIDNLLAHVFSTYMILINCLLLGLRQLRCNILFSSLLTRFFDFMIKLERIFVKLSCLINLAKILEMSINLENSNYFPHLTSFYAFLWCPMYFFLFAMVFFGGLEKLI